MLRIALCEDEEKERQIILEMLGEYEGLHVEQGRIFEIKCFTDAERFLDQILNEDFCPAIVLMDIYLSGMTGVDAVRAMREAGLRTEVVFLTTSEAHSLTAYSLDARQYLVKPIDKERFFNILDQILHVLRLDAEQKEIIIRQYVPNRGVRGDIRRISCGDILYYETQGNQQILHTRTEDLATRLRFAEMQEKLSAFPEFFSLGTSYILNLKRVVSMNEETVLLEGGRTLRVAYRRFLELKKKYFEFFNPARKG